MTKDPPLAIISFLGANLISWSSKKQPTVFRSSTKAEYRFLAHTTAELTWLQMFVGEFSIPQPYFPVIWCDNQSALSLAANPVFYSRSKHIEVDYHFVGEKVVAHKLLLHHVSSSVVSRHLYQTFIHCSVLFSHIQTLGCSLTLAFEGGDKEKITFDASSQALNKVEASRAIQSSSMLAYQM